MQVFNCYLFLYTVGGAQKGSKESCMENIDTHQISHSIFVSGNFLCHALQRNIQGLQWYIFVVLPYSIMGLRYLRSFPRLLSSTPLNVSFSQDKKCKQKAFRKCTRYKKCLSCGINSEKQ